MTQFDRFADKLSSDFIDIMRHTKQKQNQLESLVSGEAIPSEVKEIAASGKRIGYIVATCDPLSKAHLELAQQALETLNLDKLVFIIWPVKFTPGFHSIALENTTQQNTTWEDKIKNLWASLESANDDRITILKASKDWYFQSEQISDIKDPMNPFWTGTWFVIRKLQYFLNMLSTENKEFFFCCCDDQFNANIQALANEAQDEVWKNFSIPQQLALHHVFVVPTIKGVLQQFTTPTWSSHKVFMGKRLKNSFAKPAKAKTINMVNVGCIGGVTNYLIQMGYLAKE